MVVPTPDPQRIREDVARLRATDTLCIDASSMIICNKAGILDTLGACCRLITVQAVLAETGYTDAPVSLLQQPEIPAAAGSPPGSTSHDGAAPDPVFAAGLSGADRTLLSAAITARLPLVSDDLALLAACESAGIPFFNALMMLNLLLARGAMPPGHRADAGGPGGASETRRLLLKAGRYHPDVVAYADAVSAAIAGGATAAR